MLYNELLIVIKYSETLHVLLPLLLSALSPPFLFPLILLNLLATINKYGTILTQYISVTYFGAEERNSADNRHSQKL